MPSTQTRCALAAQVVQLRLNGPFGRVPEFLVDVNIDVFNDVARRGLVAEIPERGADLFQPLVPMRQVSLRDRFQVGQFRPVPGQHLAPAQAAEPAQ